MAVNVDQVMPRCHAQVAQAFTQGVGVDRPIRELVLGEFPSFTGEWFARLQEVETDGWRGYVVTPEPPKRLVSVYVDPMLDGFSGTPLPSFSMEELVRVCGRVVTEIPVSPALVERISSITMPILPQPGVQVRDGTSYLVLATALNGVRAMWFHEPSDDAGRSVLELIRSVKACR
jgi:hypothetical protein